MATIRITQPCQSISETELQEFEDSLKIKLPQDYRGFLLAHNGGEPNPARFDVDIDGFANSTAIRHFFCLSDEGRYSLSRCMQVYKNRIPYNLLPIARPLASDLICLSVSGEDYSKVYYWDHNWEVTESTPDYSNVHFLAESFTSFLDVLYDDEVVT